MAERKRKAITEALDQVHSFLAPVRRLPDDILFLIFQEFQHDERTTLLDLMAVCRKWHGVVSGHPALWTHISILPKDFIYGSPRRVPSTKRIYAYLTRSRKALLDIIIDLPKDGDMHEMCRRGWDWDNDDPDHDRSSCDRVRDVYLKLGTLLGILVGIEGCHMKRWKSFLFLHHSPRWLKKYCDLRVLQYPAPQLQELVLREWVPEHTFGETPRLSRLVLQEYRGLGSLGLVMSSITELTVHLVGWVRNIDALFQLLSLCHHLKVFRVHTEWHRKGQLQSAPKPRLSLPSLQDLEVQTWAGFDYVLATLDLPNLINLDVRVIEGEDNYGAIPLRQTQWPTWFQRIRRLGIELPESSATKLQSLLGEAQEVEALVVGPRIRKIVEEMLAVDLALCPKLQELRAVSYTRASYDRLLWFSAPFSVIPLSHSANFSVIPFSTRQAS